ncbi:MAG: AlpA family phage regulatory protein [Colwellia sp.]|nr:AlpA family phage regulatory protein [Colwellia sp.]
MLQNTKNLNAFNPIDRFVREAECKLITGISRTRRWELEKEGKFPKRIKLSERAVAWRLSSLMQWMEERCNGN